MKKSADIPLADFFVIRNEAAGISRQFWATGGRQQARESVGSGSRQRLTRQPTFHFSLLVFHFFNHIPERSEGS